MTGSESSILNQISSRLKTSSAVVPALLATVIGMPIGAAGLTFGKSEHATLFAIALLSPLVVVLIQIAFFTLFDRDRLHNEEHIERRMLIDRERTVIGDNNRQEQITIDEGVLIENRSEGKMV